MHQVGDKKSYTMMHGQPIKYYTQSFTLGQTVSLCGDFVTHNWDSFVTNMLRILSTDLKNHTHCKLLVILTPDVKFSLSVQLHTVIVTHDASD